MFHYPFTNSYNYGLLPVRQNRDGENGIRISQHVTGHIEVRLKSCEVIVMLVEDGG